MRRHPGETLKGILIDKVYPNCCEKSLPIFWSDRDVYAVNFSNGPGWALVTGEVGSPRLRITISKILFCPWCGTKLPPSGPEPEPDHQVSAFLYEGCPNGD